MTHCIRHRAPESTPTMDQLFLQFLDLGKTVVECCIDGVFMTNRIEKYISVNTISCYKRGCSSRRLSSRNFARMLQLLIYSS